MSVTLKSPNPTGRFCEDGPEPISTEFAIPQPFRQTAGKSSYRVLIVDDNPSIHEDFRKILSPASDADPRSDELESIVFGIPVETEPRVTFELDSAFQGQSALEKLNEAVSEGRPYALAFVDIQMPPGWDGVTTINHLWGVYPGLQVVICTAYSSYSWEDMRSVLKQPDSLLVLKKPFDSAEIQQMAHTLVRKWELNLLAEIGLGRLDASIRNLLPPSRETGAALGDCGPGTPVSTQSDELQLVATLQRLGQTLESTRGKLRHAEQQLVHSEKMASIGRLSAGILHEINNPLNYALAALTVLENSANRLPENIRKDQLDTVKDLRDGCSRMQEITSSLHKFAYPESGNLRKVQVNDAVRTALRLMAVEIGDGVIIENRISNDVNIWGSASQLTKVFINLIHNSAHALRMKSHETGTVPRIHFEAAAVNGRTIISVTDNGTGIPQGDLGKIFDPFYTTRDVGQGIGLGLGTCHQILQQFRATIKVESIPGVHTRFDLSFPEQGF
ncbi:MAG: ATP-binding protein [Luteolibacter sp.]